MYREATTENLSRSQFDSARLGFLQMLRKRHMTPRFIDRHAEDLFAQACFEYSRQCAEGKVIHDPPAWIINCGWNRTRNLMDSNDRRPDRHLAEAPDEYESPDASPEEELLEEDRRRKIHDAIGRLPEYQRRLLALSYFEDESVREAARRLGWTASKAQRAHETAQRRLSKLLGVQTSDELEIVGLAAFLSVAAGREGRRLRIGGAAEGALDLLTHHSARLGERAGGLIHRPLESPVHPTRLLGRSAATAAQKSEEIGRRGPLRRIGDLGRRLLASGGGEAGTALAGEGGTRALEVCKGLAVCVMVGGGALGGAAIGGSPNSAQPVGHRNRSVEVTSTTASVPARAPAGQAGLPVEPAPRGTPHVHQSSTGAGEKAGSGSKTHRVEAAEAAEETKASGQAGEEEAAEATFRDFAATEPAAEPSAAAQSRSVTASATTSRTQAATPEASPRQKAEEAQAAQEFHGLLE